MLDRPALAADPRDRLRAAAWAREDRRAEVAENLAACREPLSQIDYGAPRAGSLDLSDCDARERFANAIGGTI